MPIPNINGGTLTPAVVTASRINSTSRGSSSGGPNVGSILSMGNGIAGALISGFQNMRQRQWSEEQAKIAYDRQVEQWRRENAYNSPSAMVARLRAAGINVNDAFSGQGAQPAGGLSSIDKASFDPLSISGAMSAAIGAGVDVQNAATSKSRAVAQNALDLEQIQRLKNLIENTSIDSSYKSVLLKYLDRSESLRLNNIEVQMALTSKQREYISEQIRYYAKEISSLILNRNADTDRLKKMLDVMEQNISTSKSVQDLNSKQLEYIKGVAIANAISNVLGSVTSAAGLFIPGPKISSGSGPMASQPPYMHGGQYYDFLGLPGE